MMLTTPRWRIGTGLRLKGEARTKLRAATETKNVTSPAVKLAEQRLARLLEDIPHPEMELLEMMLRDSTRDELLMQSLRISGAIIVCSLVFSAVCHFNPIDGFHLSHPSIHHWLCGLGGATPLILLRLWMWSDATPPFIREYVDKRQLALKLFFQNLSLDDSIVSMAMIAFSANFLIYPGVVGSVSSSMGTYLGMDTAGVTGFDWILIVVGGFLGTGYASCLMVDIEEHTVLYEAIENAERYYKCTLPPGSPAPMARDHSRAFVKASLDYMETNRHACMFAMLLTISQTYYGGMLWKLTGDASTVICLFVTLSVVEIVRSKLVD